MNSLRYRARNDPSPFGVSSHAYEYLIHRYPHMPRHATQKASWTHGKRRKGEGEASAFRSMTQKDSKSAMRVQGPGEVSRTSRGRPGSQP